MGKNVNTGQHTVFRTSVATRPTMTLGGEGEDCHSSSLPPESRQTPQSSDPVETFTGDTASLTSHADTVGKRGETSIKEMHLDGPNKHIDILHAVSIYPTQSIVETPYYTLVSSDSKLSLYTCHFHNHGSGLITLLQTLFQAPRRHRRFQTHNQRPREQALRPLLTGILSMSLWGLRASFLDQLRALTR